MFCIPLLGHRQEPLRGRVLPGGARRGGLSATLPQPRNTYKVHTPMKATKVNSLYKNV